MDEPRCTEADDTCSGPVVIHDRCLPHAALYVAAKQTPPSERRHWDDT